MLAFRYKSLMNWLAMRACMLAKLASSVSLLNVSFSFSFA